MCSINKLLCILIYFSSNIYCKSIKTDSNLQLILVHSIWRHGDREPQYPFESDPLNGKFQSYGQLTQIGRRQQNQLGKLIRQRYIEKDFQFLPKYYDPKKVHIRITKRNRTIDSAKENIIGMYSVEEQKKNNEYFEIIDDYTHDCIANIQCECNRRSALQSIAHSLPEYQEFVKNEQFQQILSNLTKWTGQLITPKNFWTIVDTLKCEKIHFEPLLKLYNQWYSTNLYEKLKKYNRKLNNFQSGIYQNEMIVNGVDIRREIQKIRVGPIVNDIFERMSAKLECSKQQNPKCSIRDLQYFAYSSHDMTLYSLLTAFGIQEFAADQNGEWPDYAASIFIEFFLDTTDNLPYFRIIYRANSNSEFINLTKNINSCEEYCSFDVFKNIAKYYKIDGDINEWCHESPIDH